MDFEAGCYNRINVATKRSMIKWDSWHFGLAVEGNCQRGIRKLLGSIIKFILFKIWLIVVPKAWVWDRKNESSMFLE